MKPNVIQTVCEIGVIMSLRQNLQSYRDTQPSTLLQSSQTTGVLGLIKQRKKVTSEVIATIAVLGITTVGAVSMQSSSSNNSRVSTYKDGITRSIGVKSASTADPSAFLNSLGEFTTPNTSTDTAATGTNTATISSSVVVNGQSMTVPAAGTTTQTVISPDGSGKTNVTITSNQSSTAGSTTNNDSSPDFPDDSYSHSTLRVTTRSSAQTKSTDSLNGSGVSP